VSTGQNKQAEQNKRTEQAEQIERTEQTGQGGRVEAPARIADHTETVRPEWIDYNGHMNEAFYVLVFGHATDAMMIETGMDERYREESGCSLYTAEAHVRYRREVTEGAQLTVRTRVLGVDAKKVRLALEMRTADSGSAVATTELLMIHVDQSVGGSAPFPDAVRERLASATEVAPQWAGGSIGPVPKA
jgi:acyl-CoA thioester hydrolase